MLWAFQALSQPGVRAPGSWPGSSGLSFCYQKWSCLSQLEHKLHKDRDLSGLFTWELSDAGIGPGTQRVISEYLSQDERKRQLLAGLFLTKACSGQFGPSVRAGAVTLCIGLQALPTPLCGCQHPKCQTQSHWLAQFDIFLG